MSASGPLQGWLASKGLCRTMKVQLYSQLGSFRRSMPGHRICNIAAYRSEASPTFQMGGSSWAFPRMLTPLMWWCTPGLGMLSCFWEGMPLPILDREAPREGIFLSSKLTARTGAGTRVSAKRG